MSPRQRHRLYEKLSDGGLDVHVFRPMHLSPRAIRGWRAAALFVVSLFLWGIATEYFKDAHPWLNTGWAALIALASGLTLGLLLPVPRVWRELRISGRWLQFSRPGEDVEVSAASIRVIAAEAGVEIAFDARLVSKTVFIGAEERRFRVHLPPLTLRRCYAALAENCPGAVGLPLRGAIRWPQLPPGPNAIGRAAEAAQTACRDMRRQSLRAAAIGTLMVLGAAAGCGALFFAENLSLKSLRLIGPVAVAGLVLIGHAWSRMLRALKLSRTIAAKKVAFLNPRALKR